MMVRGVKKLSFCGPVNLVIIFTFCLDLEPETLTLLSAICLAQAQELVVQKALKVCSRVQILNKQPSCYIMHIY